MDIDLCFTINKDSLLVACHSVQEANSLGVGEPFFYDKAIELYGKDVTWQAIKQKQQVASQQLIADGWIYIPQFGCHAGHFVSPTWAAKYEIPPQPDAGDLVAFADWIVGLKTFSHIHDQDLKEQNHLVYFP
jgi:hypothetical protein